MMFPALNASDYDHNGIFYNAEFEDLLSKIIICYNLMITDKIIFANDENTIRDVLYLNYLNNNTIRKSIGLQEYYFDRETLEDRTVGRIDIRILTANSFIETAAYYILECKRLDGTNPNGLTGLNARYIENGVYRFTSKTYSAYYKTNGMIGFIVQPINISQNIASINQLLKTTFTQANTTKELEPRNLISDFDHSYCSTHNIDGNDIVLYHLMLDYSNNIQN